MTGEITLHGDVLPIGGLKEKSMAAYREGMQDGPHPQATTSSDLYEVDDEVKKSLAFVPRVPAGAGAEPALLKPSGGHPPPCQAGPP